MKLLHLFFWSLIVSSCSVDQIKTDTLREKKIDAIFQNYDNASGPGLALGIVQNGTVLLKKGYGLANLEYDIPNTSSTAFDIASVSKQFAGLAISMLIQEGKISLKDDIHKYLPEVPDFGNVITIDHLIHHTSGLRDWPEGLNVAGWRWDEVFSFEDIIRMVKHQKELDFVPGEKFSYSNTGYNLLALIVERVTKQSFREWTDANIFVPLQMNDSHFLDNHSRIIKNMAYSYWREGNEYKKNLTGLTAIGSSSLFTSVDDLCKWVINFEKQVTSKNPIYTRMLQDGVINNGSAIHYAYGLGLGEEGGLKTVNHTGGWAGYRTVIMNYPDEKLSIILLGNVGDFNPYAKALEVASVIMKDKLKTTNTTKENTQALPSIKLKEGLARMYEGTYKLGDEWYVTLSYENGQLMTQANGEDKFPTVAKSDSVIWIDAYNSSMTFLKDKKGKVNTLRYRNITAPRMVLQKPDLSKRAQYIGTYYSEEFATEYTIDLTKDKLMMHHMRLGDFELTEALDAPDKLSSPMGSLTFFKENGKIAGFRVSRGRIKNVRFDKR